MIIFYWFADGKFLPSKFCSREKRNVWTECLEGLAGRAAGQEPFSDRISRPHPFGITDSWAYSWQGRRHILTSIFIVSVKHPLCDSGYHCDFWWASWFVVGMRIASLPKQKLKYWVGLRHGNINDFHRVLLALGKQKFGFNFQALT